MPASPTPKSVQKGNTANMNPTYSVKVACEKEKAEFSTKQTNMSRSQRGQEVSHSRFRRATLKAGIQRLEPGIRNPELRMMTGKFT